MTEIELTRGKVALIDDEDWPLVSGYKWSAKSCRGLWYAQANTRLADGRGTMILMHRLLLGLTDPKVHVDHADMDGLNNRRANIRPCGHNENMRNRGAFSRNTSGFKGVTWEKAASKWRAQIYLNGKNRHLGLFVTPEEAHQAYCQAAVEFYGEFANCGIA